MVIQSPIGVLKAGTEEEFHAALAKLEGLDRVYTVPPHANIDHVMYNIEKWGKSYEAKRV